MTSARVNNEGEIKLPKSVLERMGVKAGDQLEFVEVRPGRRSAAIYRHTTFGH